MSERIVGEPARAETAEIGNVTLEANALPTATPIVPEPTPAGPMLVGRSAPVTGRIFPLAFGRHLIGRGPDADIHLSEASVSLRHAELELRPDGAQLVNLISTNGTWINGAEIHTARLGNGDSIRIGRETLQYREPTALRSRRGRLGLWIIGCALVAAAAIVLGWHALP